MLPGEHHDRHPSPPEQTHLVPLLLGRGEVLALEQSHDSEEAWKVSTKTATAAPRRHTHQSGTSARR